VEWLEKLLEGIANKDEIVANIKKELGVQFIPKAKFNEVNEELKAQKEQVSKNETTIKELQDKAKTSEEKDKIIETLKKDNETFKSETEKRILNTQKRASLMMKLSTEVDASVVDLVANLVNLEGVKYENDKITNYDEVIKSIKEERATLFKTEQPNGKKPPDGTSNPDNSSLEDADFFSKVMKPL
jgi:predicted DNA-binding protein (UPF0278 family)